jgi:phosphopantothenoylcysteine decarboxylase
MARIILGVTGSVAAIRTPALARELAGAKHEVRIVATDSALYFFDPSELETAAGLARQGTSVRCFRDSDEWPGDHYERDDPVLHIEFRKWADLLVVAPLDANTLAKFALGLSDNFLSCVFRAWDFSKPVILAPAMNTLMWESPVTLRHLRQLLADRSPTPITDACTLAEAAAAFARSAPALILIPPQAKRLACGDVGVGAMAEVNQIAEVVRRWLEEPAPAGQP